MTVLYFNKLSPDLRYADISTSIWLSEIFIRSCLSASLIRRCILTHSSTSPDMLLR